MISDKNIKEAMEAGHIIIDKFDERQLGPNSYDVRLGEFYFDEAGSNWYVHLDDEDSINELWSGPNKAHRYVQVCPGETVLTHTQEIIGCKELYVPQMRTRSTIARCGLSVCRCAGVGDVGYVNKWTMEISNHTQTNLYIPVGMRIASISFSYVGPTHRKYQGKYGQGEWKPEDMLPKPFLDWDVK